MEQMEACWTHDPKVVGSNPTPAFYKNDRCLKVLRLDYLIKYKDSIKLYNYKRYWSLTKVVAEQ